MAKPARFIVTGARVATIAALLGLWVRGYFVSDLIGRGSPTARGTTRMPTLMSGRGGVALAVFDYPGDVARLQGWHWDTELPEYAADFGRRPWQTLGFLWVRLPPGPPVSGWAVVVPLWFPVLLLAARPAWHLRTVLRDGPARRRRLGLCVGCGYDLRASAGRCPECGEPIQPASPPPAPGAAVPAAPDA